jgi:hypothetical protein
MVIENENVFKNDRFNFLIPIELVMVAALFG